MKKRSIAFLTSLIMLISMLPTAFASSGGGLKPGTGKMKFQLDYMQYTEVAKKAFEDDQAGDAEFSSIDDVGGDKAFYKKGIVEKQDKPKKSAIKVGDEFLVGVKMVDFDNVVESGDGINNMCITLKYDPDYIIAEDTISSLTDDSRNRLGARTGNIFTKHTQSMKYNVSYSFNSNSGDVRADGTINLPLLTSNMDVNSTLTGETDEYIAVLKFKVKAIPTDAKKVIYFPDDTLLANIERFTIALGTRGESATYSADVAEVNIKSIMSLDDSNLDIFPAGAATRTGISVKSGTMASTQFVGDVFKPGVTMQYDLSDAKHEDLDTSDTVTYKYGAASITAADDSGLTAIPATLTTDVNGKHIYAIVGNFICDLGALTVSEIKTTKITVSGAPTTAYDGTAIDFKNLVAKIEKNNGTSVGDIKFTNNYENVSNDLAIYKSNADGDVLAQVTTSDTYTHGPNYFVVAVKSDTTVKSTVFTVTSNYDDITITKDTNAKTSYNKGDKFDPSAIAVKAKKASETGEGTKVSYADFDGNYKVVIATNAEEAKTATAVDANTDITEAMLDGTHKVFVVYTNAGSGVKSVAEVGTLGAKKIKSATISGGKTAYTYGDKLKTDDLKLNVTYDDNSTGKISYADLAAAGITVKIGDTVVKADTVITPDMKDKTVDFIYDSKTLTSSAKITVAAKTVYYTVSDATITKVYDGGLTIPADQTLPTISIKDLATAFVGTDSYTVTGTFAYTDKNVGTDKKIKLTTTLPETNGKYTFAPDTDKINADGTLKTAATITAKALTLNPGVITGLSTKADPNATADVTKDGSLVLTKDNSNLVDGDNVTVPYTYTFGKDDVKTAGNDKPVKIALGDLTGADKDNYTFDKTQVTTAKGNVTQEAFSDIEISGPTKKTYTYPELIPDLSDLVVNAVYGTGTSAIKVPVTNYKLLDKDGNEFDKTAKLPYGDTKITVSYTEGLVTKTKTITLTAKKKPIKLSEITFEASKAYGDDNVNASATLPTDAIIATDADKVKLTFKAEFATPEQVGDAQKVTFSDFKFAKVGEGTEDVSGNYVLVNDEGTEIAADKTVEGTGKITQGTQVAPVAPTVSVNQKTNNIVVAGPLGDNIEYSINGTDWQTGTTFTGLENGKAYTVSARYKATETLAASPASTADATTYKNHLVVYKVNTSTSPLAEIYTNETSATSDNDINTKILTAKPSKFKAYFTDLAGKTAITYPFTLSTETTLYMSQTAGGGGGGGGRSVSIKLDKDTVSGVVGDKIKVTATVTGSTAKPTWTSSNEDVATVDENGNITFVGKGTATVKVKVNGVVKNIPVTVKEATATPTPVPTVKPTEAPVINTEYTKPYASGYDDGSFLPNNNITRGELAAMIARLSYGDDLPDGIYQASFPDVDSDAWFNKYIGYLEDKDVLSGYEDGTFRPMDTITRGEISAVIARAQRYDLISYNGIFTDVTENDWAKDYIETLADKNIVSGYEDGTFGPYSPLTRAEAVAIINRVLVESTPIVTFTPNDIAGHWAEADILLAVNERMVGANAVVPTVTPEETAAPEETVAPETTVTPEATVAPEKTTAPEATPAA
ncbi:MAG: S-layer homology domain-containing protein [Hominilimicola sp.]|uniref:S-layer homology domain-containing protein n=1 Tax=Hominilimicola sp. TaxID=3073571 RepID=UPI0039995E0E